MSITSTDPRYRHTQKVAAENITRAFQEQLLALVNNGFEVTILGSAELVAKRLIDRLPVAENPWSEIIGSCYTSGALQRELGIGRGAVSKAVREDRMLRLETSDRQTLYPSFQVHDGALVRGLGKVLPVLRAGINDPWSWAQWLNTPRQTADGVELPRRIEELLDGNIDDVVTAAKHAAAAWAA